MRCVCYRAWDGAVSCQLGANVPIVSGLQVAFHGPLDAWYAAALVNLLDKKMFSSIIQQYAAHLLIRVHIRHPGMFRQLSAKSGRVIALLLHRNTSSQPELHACHATAHAAILPKLSPL